MLLSTFSIIFALAEEYKMIVRFETFQQILAPVSCVSPDLIQDLSRTSPGFSRFSWENLGESREKGGRK